MRNRPIGIFDSGIGGLTVLQNLVKELPDESYIYIGDNKNCPYGDKSKEELFTYASAIIDYFISKHVKLIVVACNTVSSNILPELILKYPEMKIIGVVDATVKLIAKADTQKTLVIATKATIESHVYKKQIETISSNIKVFELATPLLVPLIEKGNQEELERVILDYFDSIDSDYDTVLLGCTHYLIIDHMIKKVVKQKRIINSSEGIVNDVKEFLLNENLLGNKKRIQIYTTGIVQDFVFSSSNFFDYQSLTVKKLF